MLADRLSLLLLPLSLVAALVVTPAPANASAFSLFGSYAAPSDTDETVGFGVRFLVNFRSNDWGVELTSSLYDGADADVRVSADVSAKDSLRLVPLDLGLRRTWLRDGADPYFGFGGTFARLRSDLGEADDVAGFYVLGGFQLGDRQGAGFFVEAQYRNLSEVSIKLFEGQASADQPVVDLSGFSVNVGVTWNI
jgi:hypothetical protein